MSVAVFISERIKIDSREFRVGAFWRFSSEGPTSLKKDESAVHYSDPALSVLVMVGVSKRLSRSISLAVYCLSSHFLADQIS